MSQRPLLFILQTIGISPINLWVTKAFNRGKASKYDMRPTTIVGIRDERVIGALFSQLEIIIKHFLRRLHTLHLNI